MILSRGDWGRLVLRVAFGGLMLFHGVAKVRTGVSGIESMLESHGLPGWLAYGTYLGEVLAPLLLLLGVFTVPAAVLVAFNMFVAIWVAHGDDIFSLGQHGEWAIESPLLYMLGAIAIALLGPGEITIRRVKD
jgi:putative oxidoreductase